MRSSPVQPSSSADDLTTLPRLLRRVFWSALGPAFLLLTALFIVNHSAGWFTAQDATYWIIFALIVAARGGDRWRAPTSLRSESELPGGELRRFIPRAVAVALILWIVANVLGNHVLNGKQSHLLPSSVPKGEARLVAPVDDEIDASQPWERAA